MEQITDRGNLVLCNFLETSYSSILMYSGHECSDIEYLESTDHEITVNW